MKLTFFRLRHANSMLCQMFFSKTSKIKPNLCKICEREDRDNDAMSKKLKSDVLPLTCQFNASLDANCWKVNLCLDGGSAENKGIQKNQTFYNCLKPKLQYQNSMMRQSGDHK